MDIEKMKQANTKRLGKNILYYETIDSTQEEAKRIVDTNIPSGTVIIAEEQTKGKGTKGRQWYTQPNANITMTIILFPQCAIEKLEGLTITIAQCIQQAIEELYGYKLEIKEPNDLLYQDKKICGILTRK